ncbi:MAG TPA: hypothetical protein VMJ73_06540 [Rhizomicrobium sp.]|nr:hypothetical protein [Rhizomicrobium sp.]
MWWEVEPGQRWKPSVPVANHIWLGVFVGLLLVAAGLIQHFALHRASTAWGWSDYAELGFGRTAVDIAYGFCSLIGADNRERRRRARLQQGRRPRD